MAFSLLMLYLFYAVYQPGVEAVWMRNSLCPSLTQLVQHLLSSPSALTVAGHRPTFKALSCTLRGIVVSALTWHSLGREIESCPGILGIAFH